MARPNFNLIFAGTRYYSRPNGSGATTFLTRSAESSETISGTSRRKPKGWMNPSGYSLDIIRVDYQTGRMLFAPLGLNSSSGSKQSGVLAYGSGAPFNGSDHFNAVATEANVRDDNGLRNQALIRARNNLKSSDINLGVSFAERNRTAKLVGDTTIQLVKSVQQLRRGEIRKAMRTLGISSRRAEPRGSSVPSKWLELQYGWKPLLSEVYGACDALSKRNKEDWRVTAKGKAFEKSVGTVTRNLNWAVTNGHGGSTTAEGERYALVRIDALPQNEAIISLASAGITNPALIGWELVPFSFVVDWFLPIGSWLESMDAMLGYESAWTSTTYFARCKWIDVAAETKVNGNNIQEAYYSGSKTYVHLRRTAQSGVPIAQPPRLKDPRSFGHMANGLALLTQVFRGKGNLRVA